MVFRRGTPGGKKNPRNNKERSSNRRERTNTLGAERGLLESAKRATRSPEKRDYPGEVGHTTPGREEKGQSFAQRWGRVIF